MQSMIACLKGNVLLNEEVIFHLKRTPKGGFVTSERLDIKFKTKKILCMFLSCTKHHFKDYEILWMNAIV